METVIKDFNQIKNGFKVVKNGDLIQSVNKMGQVFHSIDLSYASKGIFFHSWEGYRTNDQFIEVLQGHFFEFFAKHKCSKMLTETSKMTGTFAAANEWLANEFTPKLISQGVTKHAVVLASNIFAQLAAEEWEQKVSGFTNRNFGNLNDAVKWLGE
jgi:hypothetical protein